MTISMSAPDITDSEIQAVLEVLRTPRLSLGPRQEAFEAAVAGRVGARHAVAVSSGTAGLHLAVRAAGIGDGDLVVTTPFSFVASANVMLYERAVPIFVDVDPVTGNIDPSLVEEAIHDLLKGGERAARRQPRRGAGAGRLKAVLPVDAFGQPAAYEVLVPEARKHELTVIEDSCESFGALRHGRPAGMFGDIGVFAFYPNKQITTGEGGVVVTDRDDWADTLRSLRNQGRAPGDTWLQHARLGYNYRMDELSAALGEAQMQRFDELLDRRQRVADWYGERLSEQTGVQPLTIDPATTRVSWFVYVVRFEAGLDRDAIAGRLERSGIPSRPYFTPIHLQPYFVERFGYRAGDFPVAEDLGRRSLALPFSSVMTEGEVDEVCRALREAMAG
ncbi:MAG TPA: DegT/DnrJ/EryC1/StrS family aminotransferase [Anaerolineales bacterium]|nr:DegT/DnrJ/EryC1/StrS family aminotransferase [Anaerolineales bacterium]